MVTIRLFPVGLKNKPSYRIVATDERKKLTGTPLEILGYWHPKKGVLKLDKKRLEAWVEKGAKVSPAVSKLLTTKSQQ